VTETFEEKVKSCLESEENLVIYRRSVDKLLEKIMKSIKKDSGLVIDEKSKATEIIQDCNRGIQRCHECPILSCCDNTSENAEIVRKAKKNHGKS